MCRLLGMHVGQLTINTIHFSTSVPSSVPSTLISYIRRIYSLIMCSVSDLLELLSLLVHVTVVPLRKAVARKLRDETKQLWFLS